MQSVLRCGQCNKPFDKQSTLKRHGYYCRSRRAGRTTARPRSCISCARAKMGCDNRRPKCSTCITKAIDCHYPTVGTPIATASGAQHGHGAPDERGIATLLSPKVNAPGDEKDQQENNGDLMLDGALVPPDLDFAFLNGDYVDWDSADFAITDFSNLQTNVTYPTTPGSSSAPCHLTPPVDQTAREHPHVSFAGSIARAPNHATRTLIERPRMQPGAQRIASLLRHTLNSYLVIMLRHDGLPPFVHPSSLSLDVDKIHMEPLTNCISLVRMIGGRVQGSRKLFWKNVRLECERLSEEHLKLSKWELLAAMQALSVYVLLRLDEDERDHNANDFLLVRAVILISQQLCKSDATCHLQCTLCNNGLETSWKDWIFRESRRRLAILYRVVNMLIYFEPASKCDLPSDLILAPLPAKRQLWEAGDQLVWKAESQKEPSVTDSFGLAADGEIVKLDDGRLSCSDTWISQQSSDTSKNSSRNAARWEEWCSGMDGFGGLVMLAASLMV